MRGPPRSPRGSVLGGGLVPAVVVTGSLIAGSRWAPGSWLTSSVGRGSRWCPSSWVSRSSALPSQSGSTARPGSAAATSASTSPSRRRRCSRSVAYWSLHCGHSWAPPDSPRGSCWRAPLSRSCRASPFTSPPGPDPGAAGRGLVVVVRFALLTRAQRCRARVLLVARPLLCLRGRAQAATGAGARFLLRLCEQSKASRPHHPHPSTPLRPRKQSKAEQNKPEQIKPEQNGTAATVPPTGSNGPVRRRPVAVR